MNIAGVFSILLVLVATTQVTAEDNIRFENWEDSCEEGSQGLQWGQKALDLVKQDKDRFGDHYIIVRIDCHKGEDYGKVGKFVDCDDSELQGLFEGYNQQIEPEVTGGQKPEYYFSIKYYCL